MFFGTGSCTDGYSQSILSTKCVRDDQCIYGVHYYFGSVVYWLFISLYFIRKIATLVLESAL